MPTKIGTFKVITNTGTINNGNSLIIAPTQNIKSFNGSGTGVTGDRAMSFSFFSATITTNGSFFG